MIGRMSLSQSHIQVAKKERRDERTHIAPLLAGKDGNQFGIWLQSAEVLLIVDLGAIAIQVYRRLSPLKFQRHLRPQLRQRCGHNCLADVPRDVLDLEWRRRITRNFTPNSRSVLTCRKLHSCDGRRLN